MARLRVKVFFDGGCRPNPGPMEAAVVLRGVAHFHDGLGVGSNCDAEWHALICALELAQSSGLSDFELIGDAREVIRQANAVCSSGKTASSGEAATGHAATLLSVAAKGRPARIRWIKREQNLAGIALASRHPR